MRGDSRRGGEEKERETLGRVERGEGEREGRGVGCTAVGKV